MVSNRSSTVWSRTSQVRIWLSTMLKRACSRFILQRRVEDFGSLQLSHNSISVMTALGVLRAGGAGETNPLNLYG
jgi:hypothetical protein